MLTQVDLKQILLSDVLRYAPRGSRLVFPGAGECETLEAALPKPSPSFQLTSFSLSAECRYFCTAYFNTKYIDITNYI
jgi:hypothetical protein